MAIPFKKNGPQPRASGNQGQASPAEEQTQAPSPGEQTIRALKALHQLTIEACLSEDHRELVFRILNRTVLLLPYDRAVLWDLRGPRPKLLGVSGKSHIAKSSPLVMGWRRLVRRLKEPMVHQVLQESSFSPEATPDWQNLHAAHEGVAALWVPIVKGEENLGGLWLERWHDQSWTSRDVKLTAALAVTYAAVWNLFRRQGRWRRMAEKIARPWKTLLLAALLATVLFGWQVPLRVVAPCEVVPQDPWVVTAPLNGVVAEVHVKPGESVAPGALLFSYDKRVVQEDLNVARQQVEIIRSGLNRARLQAFVDPKSRAEVKLLEHRLNQEMTRLDLAQYKVTKLEVTAETAGRVVIDDPHEWRGRPVAMGQKVMMIVDSAKNKLRIWLPESDNISFQDDHNAKIVLNALPEESFRAKLSYVAQNVTTSPEGIPSVMADAKWEGRHEGLRIGLKGTAILYGRDVSLAYWLFRKPIASTRKFLGW